MKASTCFSLAALIALNAAGAAPAWGQDRCAAFTKEEIIETIPPGGLVREGNTCDKPNLVERYDSRTCRIPEETYKGGEVVYKLRLNEGNEVSFFLELDPHGQADLVLAVLSDCDHGNLCVSSSTDFIGPKNEEIPAASYKPPGIYYLYVDTHTKEKEPDRAACGPYKLTIAGKNPVPVLSASLKAHLPGAPAGSNGKATAGRALVYELTVDNGGSAEAKNVRANMTLESPDLSPGKDSECDPPRGNLVSCSLGNIAAGGSKTINVTVNVAAKAEAPVRSKVEIKTDSGISSHADLITSVEHSSDLSIRMTANPGEAIAGRRRTYTLALQNAGPSDATQVEVLDTLDADEDFMQSEDPAAPCQKGPGPGQVLCTVARIPAHGNASPSFTVLVKPSAIAPLINTAKVGTTTGSDPKGPNEARLEASKVGRETDFEISHIETLRDGHAVSGPIPAGADFTYVITVKNNGPSDSSGATVTFTPPSNLAVPTQSVPLAKIPAGQDLPVSFSASTLSSMSPATLDSLVTVKAKESEPSPDKGANEAHANTSFSIEADLELLIGDPAAVSDPSAEPPACASGNLLYTFKVENHGPSDSRGGEIRETLPAELSFVSSPDRCTFDTGTRILACPAAPLAAKADSQPIRFVAVPSSEAAANFERTATVYGSDADGDHGNDKKTSATEVTPVADVGVTLDVSQALVAPDGALTYSVGVTNRGPSKVNSSEVEFTFNQAGPIPVLKSTTCDHCQGLPCVCDLDVGKTQHFTIEVPGAFEPDSLLEASVSATAGGACDPTEDNQATATTRVTTLDTDFGLTLTADRDAAVVGDPVVYTIGVTRRGAEVDLPTTVTVELPGTTIVGVLPKGTCGADSLVSPLTCSLAAGKALTLDVRVDPSSGTPLQSKAYFKPDPDTNTIDNTASLRIPVLRVAPLVLPFYEVAAGGSPFDLTTLYSVRSPEVDAKVRYEYVPATQPDPDPDPVALKHNATRTANLREISQLRGTTGYLGITPVDVTEDQRHSLIGDFLRVDPSGGSATGERLISTDTARIPSELCDRWSVRFLRGQPAGSGTDLLFFVPGNRGGTVATGRVFAESGAFVQAVSIQSNAEAFRYSINARDDGGRPLLAGSGSIEWTFSPGLVGSVTAVHKLGGKDEAAVPGFCRSRPRTGGASLLLPFFEVDHSRPPFGLTTLVAIRNETDAAVDVTPRIQTMDASTFDLSVVHLRGHETWTKNLRDVPELEKIDQGFITFTAPAPAILSGDFLRVGPEGRSGAALVDTSTQLCRTWDTRFVEGVANAKTLFVINAAGATQLTVNAYAEDGTPLSAKAPTAAPSLLVSASNLDLGGKNGSVRWDLGTPGYVATLLYGQGSGGRYSVLIPGACLPEEEDPPR